MKNTGFEAWKARLDYMKSDMPFTTQSEGIKTIKNEVGNLHADHEPAWRSPTRVIWYMDGRKHGIDADVHGTIHHYYENIRIPAKYGAAMGNPELLTVEEVLANINAEVRYVGVKIIGYERIRNHKNCKTLDTCDETGMELFQIKGIFDEPVCYLKVINSTAEPDGTFKNYYLCVPPEMKKCKAAVAWTFGMTAEEYAPVQET